MSMRRAIATLLLAASLQACGDAQPPQSDAAVAAPGPCAGVRGTVARTVCEDEDLRAMDADASRLYQRVLARAEHTAQTALRADHARWQRELESCAGAPEARRRDCIDEHYNRRIVELSRY